MSLGAVADRQGHFMLQAKPVARLDQRIALDRGIDDPALDRPGQLAVADR